MADLTDYERRGDLNAPFELTKKQQKAQKEAARLRQAHCEVPSLTWEAYVAGEPCPGCGLPYRDGRPWEFKGTMHFTEAERARYDAEEARFNEAHGDCHASRHSVSGSLTMHCAKCCPMPPLSPAHLEEIARILSRPARPHELTQWRLRPYCGHVVDKHSHRSHTTLRAAFMGATRCPVCGLDSATIVDGEAIGLVEAAPSGRAAPPSRPTRSRQPTRTELEAKVRELEAEIERLGGV